MTRLTYKTYLKAMDETKIVARLDSAMDNYNQLVTEVDRDTAPFAPDIRHYLVGEIADRLYAYEQLGYSPEELKKIVKEHEDLNVVTKACNEAVENMRRRVFITTARQNGKSLMDAWKTQRAIYGCLVNDVEQARNLAFHHNPTNIIGHVHKAEAKHDGLSAKVTLIDEMHMVKADEYARCKNPSLAIENVIFNDPATIVFWKDGTKTVVKATNEEFDPEKGLAMAIAKKALGNKHDYYNVFKKWLKKWKKSKEDTTNG